MALFRTNNPAYRSATFDRVGSVASEAEAMTYGGTLGKTGALFAILLVAAGFGWAIPNLTATLVMVFAALAVAIFTVFKPQAAPYTAPLYAVIEGYVIGVVSLIYTLDMQGSKYSGIVPLAILGTLAVFAVMLGLYATRIIRVTETFAMVVIGATLAIALTYVGTLVIGLFSKAVYDLPMFGAGPIGILFSVFVIVIAAMNLALDFNLIETGVENRAPKYMEWYCGFGLMITLVWIYFEILRLLSKLSRR
jgi:uncharacterized YccA/Bax inhibitor family protein